MPGRGRPVGEVDAPRTPGGRSSHQPSSRRTHRMKNTAYLAAAVMLVAGTASASNTGFKLNKSLDFAGTASTNNNWLSFPTFYFPDGNVNNAAQTSVGACRD